MSKLTKPSEGYFLASRQIQDKLAGRIGVLEKKLETELDGEKRRDLRKERYLLMEIRRQIRNTMLWDTRDGE